MTHKRLYAAATIIAGAVLVSFLWSVPRVKDVEVQTEELQVASESLVAPAVELSTSYKKGTHTIEGTILAPNSCAVVSVEALPQGDPATSVVVAVTLTRSEVVCLQLPVTMEFETTVSAPEEVTFTTTVNGLPATEKQS